MPVAALICVSSRSGAGPFCVSWSRVTPVLCAVFCALFWSESSDPPTFPTLVSWALGGGDGPASERGGSIQGQGVPSPSLSFPPTKALHWGGHSLPHISTGLERAGAQAELPPGADSGGPCTWPGERLRPGRGFWHQPEFGHLPGFAFHKGGCFVGLF